jgi:hypothetical protein
LETIEQVFNGQVGWGRRFSSTISRNGDLVTTGYLEIVMKRKTANDVLVTAPFYPAEAAVKEVSLEIGGQKIDTVYSDWYRIYDELMRTGDEKEGYRRMTNFESNAPDGQVRRFYLPLLFFFNSNPGLALPLIALQYHECKIHVTFALPQKCLSWAWTPQKTPLVPCGSSTSFWTPRNAVGLHRQVTST